MYMEPSCDICIDVTAIKCAWVENGWLESSVRRGVHSDSFGKFRTLNLKENNFE